MPGKQVKENNRQGMRSKSNSGREGKQERINTSIKRTETERGGKE